MKKIFIYVSMLLCLLLAASGCDNIDALIDDYASIAEEDSNTSESEDTPAEDETVSADLTVEKDGTYTGKEEVALYIHTYGTLPENFITKKQAEKLGWNSREGNLDEIAPGKSIGGSRFGNYENQLPDGDYKECDINYTGGYRGSERIIYSEEGDIYYTGDHYATFTKLY